VPQLALYDHERDTLVSHFDRVCVPELVRRESTAYASRFGGSPQMLSCGGLLPTPTRRRTVDDAPQRPDRQRGPDLEPRLKLLPAPAVHPDLAATAALASAHNDGAATWIQIGLGKRKCLADPQSGSPKNDDQRAQPRAICPVVSSAHDGDDFLDRRRVRRVTQTFIPRRGVPGDSPACWPAIDDARPCLTKRIPSRPPQDVETGSVDRRRHAAVCTSDDAAHADILQTLSWRAAGLRPPTSRHVHSFGRSTWSPVCKTLAQRGVNR
jgi:hypothetical protein